MHTCSSLSPPIPLLSSSRVHLGTASSDTASGQIGYPEAAAAVVAEATTVAFSNAAARAAPMGSSFLGIRGRAGPLETWSYRWKFWPASSCGGSPVTHRTNPTAMHTLRSWTMTIVTSRISWPVFLTRKYLCSTWISLLHCATGGGNCTDEISRQEAINGEQTPE